MIITRCPNCHARFRVTEGQTKLAGGQVRCGACLKVFSAPEHEVSSFKPEPDTHTETVTEPRAAPNIIAPPSAQSIIPAPAPQPSEDAPPAAPPTPVAPPLTPQSAMSTPAAVSPADASNPLGMALIAEPLHLMSDDDERSPIVTAFMLLGCLLALAALLAQLLWFERASLAQQPQLHTVYNILCQRVDCSLDNTDALQLVLNHGLHIQPHPRFADALKVSIVLENTAPFQQPWPALLLRFTDIKGREVAQRTFQPDEYLDTRTLSTRKMVPGQPMQIELEIAAPGRRGVSYELTLVPPAPAT